MANEKANPDKDIIKMPEGIKIQDLSSNYKVAASEYSSAFRRANQLDSIDRGRLWSTISSKFPKYQILPDTNDVSYVKNNILASIYTVGKSAKLLPTSEHDKEIIEHLNVVLESLWSTLKVPWYQMQAGERASLMNLGITQVGWDNSIVKGTGDAFYKGQVVLKNINPLKFMRDPFAESIETAEYCMVWDDFHETVILGHKGYREAFKKLKANGQLGTAPNATVVQNLDKGANTGNKKDYYRVFTHWVNVEGKVHEVHLLNNQYPLMVKNNIKPNTFPFAELYCNLPAGDLFGTSEPAKIAANSLAYNIMSSLILTAEYKNQRPPRFINNQSMLNVAAFTENGNDADRTFVVSGDASKAVHYHQFPQPSQVGAGSLGILNNDIQRISGVDGRYTGRDTGSILTTGGIEGMLDQVTMIDAPKVEAYQHYSKRLTELIISNYIHYAAKRKYFVQNKSNLKKWNTVEVDFPEIDVDTIFNYEMSISSDLPKNKSRIEAMANRLMEMQMQYQGMGVDVDLITPEEYLMMQDLPMREYMQERMDIQRSHSWNEVVAQTITEYAGLIESGLDSNEAMAMTAQTLAQQSQPGGFDPEAIAEEQALMQGAMPPMM